MMMFLLTAIAAILCVGTWSVLTRAAERKAVPATIPVPARKPQ